MNLIRNVKSFPAKKSASKEAFILCGFGGSIWQTKRLIGVLHRAGYNITAMDFAEDVLSRGDPKLMIQLMDDITKLAEQKAKELNKEVLLVGISLGALVSLNLLRRSKFFDKGVFITGGDIVKVAQNIYGRKIWPQTYGELAKIWQNVNMYSSPEKVRGKRVLFVLPANDKLIDPDDVRCEVKKQIDSGNKVILLERRTFGHVGTIIEESILFPKRVLGYINKVENI